MYNTPLNYYTIFGIDESHSELSMKRLSSQTKRNVISYLLTIALYMPLIYFWLIYSSKLIASSSDIKVKEIVLDLSSFRDDRFEKSMLKKTKEIEPPKESVKPAKPKPTPIQTPTPKPIVDILPKTSKTSLASTESKAKATISKFVKAHPKKVAKKRVIDRSTRKKSRASKMLVKKSGKRSKSKYNTHKHSKNISHKRAKSYQKSSNKVKNQFIINLRSKIQKNKKYPRIAQKRGMQGSVKVRFTVTKAGTPSNIVVKGSRVFINATKSAIKRSFPLSTKGVPLPISISLTVNYHLNR